MLASLALVTIAYWSGLHGSFFFDDNPNILNKPGIDLDTLTFIAIRDLWQAGGAGPLGRPVAQLSFALNHYFSGFDPFFFKLTNLLIHLGNGVLVMLLAAELLRENRQARWLAGSLPVLFMFGWVVHPVQLLAVLHVTQRMTSLSAFFLLAALLCHVYARRAEFAHLNVWLLLGGWLLLWPLSIYSKESGVLFPLFVAAWEIFIRPSRAGHLDRFARIYLFGLAILMLASLVYGFLPESQWLWRGYDFRTFSLGERLLTESRVVFFYLGLILFPRLESFGLFHDDFRLSTGLLEPWTTLPSLLGLCALLWAIWWCRRRFPLAALGMAWFLIGHLLESTALPLELVHEHRNYLPLFGVLLVAVGFISVVLRSYPARGVLVALLCAGAIAYLGLLTALRSHQFGDEFRRTQLEAQHHRASARAQNDAGRVLAEYAAVDGRYSPTYGLARAHFEVALGLDPNIKISLLALLHLNCAVGSPIERPWVEELGRRLQYTYMAPGDRNVLFALKGKSIDGDRCLTRTDVDGLFAAASANRTATPGTRAMFDSWHADYLWLTQRDLPAAVSALDRSLALAPGEPSNLLKRSQLHLLAGEKAASLAILRALDGRRLSAEERVTRTELMSSLMAEVEKR